MCGGSALTECPVCYNEVFSSCKLLCGHSFCHSCIKEWYSKGDAGRACPMCRKPLYFKGLFKKQAEWNEEYYQNELDKLFANHFDSILEDEFDYLVKYSKHPRWGAFVLMIQLQDLERRFHKLTAGPDWFSIEDLEYELDEYESTPFETVKTYDSRISLYPKYIFKNVNTKKYKNHRRCRCL